MRRFLWALILGLSVIPVLFAETEYHRQEADGSVQVEVVRTPGEQQMMEHAYNVNGVTSFYVDSFNQPENRGQFSPTGAETWVSAKGRTGTSSSRRLVQKHRFLPKVPGSPPEADPSFGGKFWPRFF